jgi:hypothetical protein
VLIGTSVDDGANKLQVNGPAKFSQRPAFGAATPWDSANLDPSGYMPRTGGTFTGALGTTNVMTSTGGYNVGNGGVLLIYDTGGAGTIGFRTGGTAKFFSLDSGGNGNALNGAWINGSDARLKTNVATIDDALTKVCAMRGVYYEKKDEPGVRHVGVIAQEAQLSFPEVVHHIPVTAPVPAEDSEEVHEPLEHDDYLGVSYGNLAGPFIEAIKILADRVTALEQKA